MKKFTRTCEHGVLYGRSVIYDNDSDAIGFCLCHLAHFLRMPGENADRCKGCK